MRFCISDFLSGTIFIWICLENSIRIFVNAQTCDDVKSKLTNNFGLDGSQFWKGTADGLTECASMCMRRKRCKSINYDTSSKLCELNSGLKGNTPARNGQFLVYSEIAQWPSSIDPNCYSRPCAVDEVCIPGSLLVSGSLSVAGSTASTGCSYSCMPAGNDVCPMPAGGVSNARTVGSVNVVTCGKGFVGDDSATCLPNKTWDKEITCKEIHGHICTDNVLCSKINGVCSTSKICECGLYKRYDTAKRECVPDCGQPTAVSYAKVSGNTLTQTYTCMTGYYQTASSKPVINCTSQGWQPAGQFKCISCPQPTNVSGAMWSETGRVRQYTCENGLIPKPGTGNGTIICTDNGSWEPVGFECYGVRLRRPIRQDPNPALRGFNEGYLEMFVNGQWNNIIIDDWHWKATKVACQEINNTYKYGGTFHRKWLGRENDPPYDSALLSKKLTSIGCNGDESLLVNCPNFKVDNGDHKKDMALTCFENDVTVPYTYVGLTNVSTPDIQNGHSIGLLLTKYGGSFGTVCKNDWNDMSTTVTCKSMNTTWARDKDCNDCFRSSGTWTILVDRIKCAGDEPHLFFCENSGWNFSDSNCDQRAMIGIYCK